MHAGCVFVAGIHPSRIQMSGSFESLRWNACVHRTDVAVFSIRPPSEAGQGSVLAVAVTLCPGEVTPVIAKLVLQSRACWDRVGAGTGWSGVSIR